MKNKKEKIFSSLITFIMFFCILFNVQTSVAQAKAAAGSVKQGEKCEYYSECASGYYCHDGLLSNTCEKKLPDGSMCDSGGLSPKINNCKYGCSTPTNYNGVADSESGAVVYYCGTPPSSTGTANTTKNSETASTTADNSISGTSTGGIGIVPCGRSGGTMCTLCDLFQGILNIVKYLRNIAIGIAVLALTIGGVMYVVSAGEPGMIEMAKTTMKNAGIGFVVVLAAYLIVSTTILYIGSQSDLGIGVSWDTFKVDCTTTASSSSSEDAASSESASDATNATQSTLKEGEACVASKSPYCSPGLSCTGGKCVTEEATNTKCKKSTTQWVKTSSCASGGVLSDGTRVTATVGLADWYCSCRGSKAEGYKCCDGVATTAVLSPEKGCCLWPRASSAYTKCTDGLSSKNDCTSLTEGKGDYVPNASCKNITVGGAARKACQ